MLSSPNEVVWALVTYTEWWQPNTASIYRIGNRRASFASDGLPTKLLDTLPEREELCRRMQEIDESDRFLLYLWYVRQLSAHDVARELSIGRRQCFRRRAAAIRRIVELGEPPTADGVTT